MFRISTSCADGSFIWKLRHCSGYNVTCNDDSLIRSYKPKPRISWKRLRRYTFIGRFPYTYSFNDDNFKFDSISFHFHFISFLSLFHFHLYSTYIFISFSNSTTSYFISVFSRTIICIPIFMEQSFRFKGRNYITVSIVFLFSLIIRVCSTFDRKRVYVKPQNLCDEDKDVRRKLKM